MRKNYKCSYFTCWNHQNVCHFCIKKWQLISLWESSCHFILCLMTNWLIDFASALTAIKIITTVHILKLNQMGKYYLVVQIPFKSRYVIILSIPAHSFATLPTKTQYNTKLKWRAMSLPVDKFPLPSLYIVTLPLPTFAIFIIITIIIITLFHCLLSHNQNFLI